MSKVARYIVGCLIITLFILSHTHNAYALVVLQDEEIEHFLNVISKPIFDAAHLSQDSVSIVLVSGDDVNAYVSGGQNIFIYTGLIERTESLDELAGVIAHETGHIASGHLVRGHIEQERLSYQTMFSTIVGIAAGVLSGKADVAAGLAAGGAEATRRTFLKYSRTFEASADQSAIRYLHANKKSIRGLYSFLEKLGDQTALLASQQDEYVMTHPITGNRLAFIKEQRDVENDISNWTPFMVVQYERIKAKIIAYQHPERVPRLYGEESHIYNKNVQDKVTSDYAVAIAAYRMGDMDTAKRIMKNLLQVEPDNPFFYEFLGQISFENGEIDNAVKYYKKAYSIHNRSGLIAFALAHAMLEQNIRTIEHNEIIINLLNRALVSERKSPIIYRFLSTAYGRNGNEGMAKLSLAEESYLKSDFKQALQHANGALKLLPEKSVGWNRCQDLIRLVNRTKI